MKDRCCTPAHMETEPLLVNKLTNLSPGQSAEQQGMRQGRCFSPSFLFSLFIRGSVISFACLCYSKSQKGHKKDEVIILVKGS